MGRGRGNKEFVLGQRAGRLLQVIFLSGDARGLSGRLINAEQVPPDCLA